MTANRESKVHLMQNVEDLLRMLVESIVAGRIGSVDSSIMTFHWCLEPLLGRRHGGLSF